MYPSKTAGLVHLQGYGHAVCWETPLGPAVLPLQNGYLSTVPSSTFTTQHTKFS